ncbi:hypothetical protein MWK28_41695, partial [Escherichia coli]|nr:hypothetical protein [Escherichia coli]
RILDGFSQHFAEHTDITTQCGILFVHITPDTPSYRLIALYPSRRIGANMLGLCFSSSFIKPRKSGDVKCCEIASANE